MIERLEVIGDGGAFDTVKTNSSFLINGNILFDCGYNVFTRLMEIDKNEPGFISNIDTVIVSHLDDDHVGSLKSFLYYMYFVLGKNTTVVIDAVNIDFINGINKELKGSEFVHADIVSLIGTDSSARLYFEEKYNITPTFVKCVHHVPASGVIFYDRNGKSIAISGDTKAHSRFESEVRRIWREAKCVEQMALVFHDFSYWDAPSRQVHACESDMRVEYTDDFRKKMILYHNNKADIAGNIYNFSENGILEHKRGEK